MLPKIKCQTCGIIFQPVSERNLFHNRRCFKKAYYHRKKAEELNASHFPFFKCPDCQQMIVLDFDPVVDSMRWLKFKCPICNALMISISENIITTDSYI